MAPSPPCTVRVVDPDAAFCRRVACALTRVGFLVVAPGRVASSPAGLTVLGYDGRPATPATGQEVVLLCVGPAHHGDIAQLVQAGFAVVSHAADADRIAVAAIDAMAGWSQVPLGATADVEPEPPFAAEELAWLAALARGDRAIDVAQAHDLSERELYRRLRTMYGRVGVGGRNEAIAAAARLHLLG